METPISRVIEHQRKALAFMFDALGLRSAYEAVSRLPETRELDRAAAALEADVETLATPSREREPNDI
jgi:hypothetical protein